MMSDKPNPTGVPYPPNPPENPPHPFIPGSPGWLAYERGRAAADSWWRSRLESDETINEIAGYLSGIGGAHPENYIGAARRMVERILLPVNEPPQVPTQRITHGRHCICSPCAAEDWTNPALAPCGMHGRDCPREYQPLGGAGQVVPVNDPETDT